MEYSLLLVPVFIWMKYFKDHFLSFFTYKTKNKIIILGFDEVRGSEMTQRYRIYYKYPIVKYKNLEKDEILAFSKRNTLRVDEIKKLGGYQDRFDWREVILPKSIVVKKNILTQSIYISNRDLMES